MGNNDCLACAIEQLRELPGLFQDSQHTCEKGSNTSPGKGTSPGYTFNNYQEDTGTTAIYPEAGECSEDALTYTILGLIGEAGEIANKWKKLLRDAPKLESDPVKFQDYYDALKDRIEDELGDVLWYASQLATELGVSLGDVAAENIRKLSARRESGTLHGSGDNR